MKTITIRFTILSAIVFLSTACSGFLDVELDNEIITSEAIVNKETAEAAAIGLYNSFQGANLYGGDFVLVADLLGGNAIATGFRQRYEDLANARVPTSNPYIEDVWASLYNIINSANNILANIDGIDGIGAEDRSRIEGTAYYFRGSAYFDLLRQFGEFFNENSALGVPVFTDVLDRSTATSVGRATVAATYGRIIEDLGRAAQALPDDDERFFVTKAAAQALLARVFLYRKDWASARSFADLLIADIDYELNIDYNDNFETEGSPEAIFELQFTTQDGQGLSGLLMLSTANEVSGSNELWNAFEEGDARKAQFLRRFGVVRCTKYGELATDIQFNVPVVRLAEMYLIRSEAIANTEGVAAALADLNTVRARSLPNSPVAEADVPNLEAYYDVLIRERRLEYAFEGHYWFDLVRLGRATSVRQIEDYRVVLPIPDREVKVSNGVIAQNPGY
ncbi:MAG: RagB/SusD family nutrient uptake outer membrane protein [Phaeodactylibacter sp.]|nr:RagB/SusD family nutrient uptake outer membrane protein [Phaeodactylibacter sp.]MCB9053627.1 RagB/SusD family nutrient uptake outer membrane protein [Lewinellaceae bacterium]